MINEFVYCPRLFYYEVVDRVFVPNADTLHGAWEHRRVDGGKGDLPGAAATPSAGSYAVKKRRGKQANPADQASEPVVETIHSRSVQLGSERLGVTAKLDLVETILEAGGTAAMTSPVEYKSGKPRLGEDGAEMWDADKVQLGLQMWLLRENGYTCEEGVLYYKETRQRVRLPWSAELEQWLAEQVRGARDCAAGPRPAPLVDSPKCPRCSLAPVCLPDETNWLLERLGPGEQMAPMADVKPVIPGANPKHGPPPQPPRPPGEARALSGKLPRSAEGEGLFRRDKPRPLLAALDERRAVYFNSPGTYIGIRDRVLVPKEKDKSLDPIRLQDVNHLALFGNVQLSTQAVQTLVAEEIPITYFSGGGYFYAITLGHGLKNVMTRIEQFRAAADPLTSLALAKKFVAGKIRNHRTQLMRNHLEAPTPVLLRLKRAVTDVESAAHPQELLGMEGAAAALYFEHFGGMVKPRKAEPAEPGEAPPETWNFDFRGRNRRPPKDPVNALLSLAYSLLAKDFTVAAFGVGFDPYVGFYHQPRFGRPALALDMMEEFRALVAESAVLTAINNGSVTARDFVSAGDAVNLTPGGRRNFFEVYERRVNTVIKHPVFGYEVSYRRAFELQYRLLARALCGELADYVPFTTR